MKIEKKIEVKFKPEDVEEILKAHLLKEGIKVDSIYFSVGGHNREGDWRAEYSLDYRLDYVQCTGTEETYTDEND